MRVAAQRGWKGEVRDSTAARSAQCRPVAKKMKMMMAGAMGILLCDFGGVIEPLYPELGN